MTLTICNTLLNAVCLCFLRGGGECIRLDGMMPRQSELLIRVSHLISYRFSFCAMQLNQRTHGQVCAKCSASLSSLSDRDQSTLSVRTVCQCRSIAVFASSNFLSSRPI
jgi:hypothetical protein